MTDRKRVYYARAIKPLDLHPWAQQPEQVKPMTEYKQRYLTPIKGLLFPWNAKVLCTELPELNDGWWKIVHLSQNTTNSLIQVKTLEADGKKIVQDGGNLTFTMFNDILHNTGIYASKNIRLELLNTFDNHNNAPIEFYGMWHLEKTGMGLYQLGNI